MTTQHVWVSASPLMTDPLSDLVVGTLKDRWDSANTSAILVMHRGLLDKKAEFENQGNY